MNHAAGKDGPGERWAQTDVASTRNTFEVGDIRSQVAVVSENGSPTGIGRDVYNSGKNARFGFRTGENVQPTMTANLASGAVAMSYDGYNQRGAEETCHTLRAAASGGERDDAMPKVVIDLGGDAISRMRYIVRRITPVEAERLMGLPDNYTSRRCPSRTSS